MGEILVFDLCDDPVAIASLQLNYWAGDDALGLERAPPRVETGLGHLDGISERAMPNDRDSVNAEFARDVFYVFSA